MAAYSSILAWRILMDRGAWQAAVHGVAKRRTSWQLVERCSKAWGPKEMEGQPRARGKGIYMGPEIVVFSLIS